MKIKLTDGAKAPQRATAGAAALDLVALEPVNIPAGRTGKVRTGLHIECPEGFAALVCSRSGLASKGITVANAPGIVDSDYRGEVCVILHNRTRKGYTVQAGDRVAQLMIVPVLRPEFEVVDELSDTERGAGGFGSTGQ
jgi:dUTP pyrophosphatase